MGGTHANNVNQIEASMCHLRGLLMMKLNKTVQAKECFMEALTLDVKCYESFQQLIDTEMFTPEEGESLAYRVKHIKLNIYSLPQ